MILPAQNKQLYGLVLAGGRSVRMGEDKGMVQWHGVPQRYYVATLLKNYCEKVFISCRRDQLDSINPQYQTIVDSDNIKGPLAGILSAFEYANNVAWLVIACDLPLIDDTTISYLISNRNTSTIATTFISPFDGLPEPLITIWEPTAYAEIIEKAGIGFTCPRKILINGNVTQLNPPNPDHLMNANTPEDAKYVKEYLINGLSK
jgi:molybdopterin-guanine dinucleotide biosynthesis protein A